MTSNAPGYVQLQPYSAYQQLGIGNYTPPSNPFLTQASVMPNTPYASPLRVNEPSQPVQSSPVSLDFPGSKFLSGNLSKPFFSPTSGSGINSAIGSGLDTIGKQFGFTGAEVFGPNLPGVAPSNAGLSTAFTPANAIGGFAGNFLGNAIFGGDRGIGADIGGAVGGIAGGIGASTALGQALIPIPGVGAALGALAGNALGGLFGGPDPNPWSTWNNYDEQNKSLYNPDGTLKSEGTVSAKHMSGDFGSQMRDQVVNINQRIHQLTGMDMSNVLNITGYEKNYGGVITVNSPFDKNSEQYVPENVFYFNVEDAKDQQRALNDYAARLLQMSGMSPERAQQLAGEVTSSSSGGFQGTLGTPIIPEKSGVGNESYADFMTRYRNEGATTPIMGKNEPYENKGPVVI